MPPRRKTTMNCIPTKQSTAPSQLPAVWRDRQECLWGSVYKNIFVLNKSLKHRVCFLPKTVWASKKKKFEVRRRSDLLGPRGCGSVISFWFWFCRFKPAASCSPPHNIPPFTQPTQSWFIHFFLWFFFFHIFSVQMYNPNLRNLIYMEKIICFV